jgi:signal peptidase II
LSAAAHLRLWLVAVGGVALDLWSKTWAFDTLRQGQKQVLIPHMLEFQTMLNSGALFGIGAGHTELFLVASVLALGLVAWMFSQSSQRRWLVHVALGGILAGALGNMYDRAFVKLVEHPVRVRGGAVFMVDTGERRNGMALLREYPPHRPGETKLVAEAPPQAGFVRDFIKIPTTFFGRELWPWVFNVADMLLVGGVGILAIHLWRDRRPRATGDRETSAAASGGGVAAGVGGSGPAA